YLSSDIKKLILGMVDIGYTGEQGLKELLAKSEDLFHQEEIYSEKKIVDRFLLHLAKDDGLESYGEEEVMKNLKNGTVELLILSESLPMDTVDRFSAEAEKFGTKIELISVDFPEGIQLKELGGIAAILRYKV
ncbi:MAG: peptide chain release factor 1, partial [Candidatus Nanoarchaeia archaeon]|nr:peptide chain release factor 1 [Candidatus Nanoarchaeia archaeon]